MLMKFIARRALAVIARREPDFKIGPPGDLYMLRWWWLPRNRFFNVYIHRIRHDDDDRALHDHPWASLSYMIEGALREVYQIPGARRQSVKVLLAGDWVYRSPKFAHRLRLASKTATTIFITGPVVREWGFHCPKGWRPWREFCAPGKPGQVGRGCGED